MTEKLFDVEGVRILAFKLSPEEQFRLATFIAENVGYVLAEETRHSDEPEEQLAGRKFYQSHECQGFRAKVTIEWSAPKTIDIDLIASDRAQAAEDIADSILSFAARRVRGMVQAMRGYTASSQERA